MSSSTVGVVSATRLSMVGYTHIRVVLGLVLLVASTLKATQLVGNPLPGTSMLTSRWFVVIVVQGEWVLSALLVSGLWLRPTWGITLASFFTFVVVALYKAISGETSCGCFGSVTINPWYMVVFDYAVVMALLWYRPGQVAPHSLRWYRTKVAIVLSISTIVGVPSAVLMAFSGPKATSVDGLVEGRTYAILEPQKWVGRRLPLLPRISVGKQLAAGEWTVVLYHYDCPNCRTVLPEFVRTAEKWLRTQDRRRMALIEVPPYAPIGESPVSGALACLMGRLPEERTWFVRTPTVISLVDGEVKAVSQENAK